MSEPQPLPPAIDFRPVGLGHLDQLWEWHQRPHVAEWFAPWMAATREQMYKDWTSMIEGHEPERGYLMVVDGIEVGYIAGYRLNDAPEMSEPIGLGQDAVAADLFIADPGLIGQGLGPVLVGRFYLKMMDETRLDVGVIDPEVDNHRAIRAYEKAGFTFIKVINSDGPRNGDHIMRATRADLEAALSRRGYLYR